MILLYITERLFWFKILHVKVYRRILGPVYDNERENWRILTKEEIYANIKIPTITEIISLHRLR